jgi:putrescine aminotransferase
MTSMGRVDSGATETAAFRDSILKNYQRHVNSTIAKVARVTNLPVEVRSEGCLVYDESGDAYLNCGGYGVFLLGHRHPAVADAVKAQLDRHPLVTRVLLNAELARASASLAACTPPGLDCVLFTNSGGEAVEAGLKLARLAGKTRIVSTMGGFHGKTLGALSVTGRAAYRTPFEPLLPDVEFVPYGEAEALGAALSTDGDRTCVILEPVQGESGVVIPPDGYLRDARRLCDLHGAILILDEIQTGMGRLGSWWGSDREQVIPDILLAGKTLGGGIMPVGAVVTSTALFTRLHRDPFLHTSTFGGNPLAMAAVQSTIDVIRRDAIVSKAATLGEAILNGLARSLDAVRPDLIADVRGVGLLIGIEFRQEHVAVDFMHELLRARVIASNSLNAFRVARLTPPAVMTDSECQWLFDAVGQAAAAVKARHGGPPSAFA